jgi:hypothetical protein
VRNVVINRGIEYSFVQVPRRIIIFCHQKKNTTTKNSMQHKTTMKSTLEFAKRVKRVKSEKKEIKINPFFIEEEALTST